MTYRKTLSTLVAASLAFGSAASAATLGADGAVRQSAAFEEGEGLAGAGLGWIIAALVAAGIVLVIIEDDEEPSSP